MALDDIQRELALLDAKSPFDLLSFPDINLSAEAQIAWMCKIIQIDAVAGAQWYAQFQAGEVSPQELYDRAMGLIRDRFQAENEARLREIRTKRDQYQAQLRQNNLDPAIRAEITSRLDSLS